MSFPEGDARARSTTDAVARRSYGKLVAFLAARTRDVAAAEDALSEAFAAALADWPVKGCPAHPDGRARRCRDRCANPGSASRADVRLRAPGDRRRRSCAADSASGARAGCEDHRLGVPHVSRGHG